MPSGNFFNNTANAVKISLAVKPVTIPLIPSSSQSFLFNALPVIALTCPMDAFEYAKEHKDEQVVFLSVGFETTTPASCLSVKMAKEAGLTNYALSFNIS